jgi:aminopeptidase-like protein
MADAEYEVVIDATLAPGALTYGEYLLPGGTDDEVLVSTHCCHPSLANDNLSGIAVAVGLAQHVAALPRRRYTYRFLFIPGTIGAITWLARNEAGAVPRIRHGVVLTGLGDAGGLTYKRSRREDAPVDRAASHVLTHRGRGDAVRPFTPYGYDERQFCSPGFDLPVGRLSRTPHGEYPEYHTSADNLAFVKPESLADSLDALVEIVEILEHDAHYRNLSPKGEPQLGRRGLYHKTGGGAGVGDRELALLWVLSYADGRHGLLEIAERAGIPFAAIVNAARDLEAHGLLQAINAAD